VGVEAKVVRVSKENTYKKQRKEREEEEETTEVDGWEEDSDLDEIMEDNDDRG
jgi:hypothetical protein